MHLLAQASFRDKPRSLMTTSKKGHVKPCDWKSGNLAHWKRLAEAPAGQKSKGC